AGFEVEFFVPGAGLVVLGVDDEGADAGDVGGLGGPEQRILEKCPSEATSLLRLVDGETREKHDGDRVPRLPLSYTAGGIRMFDRTDRQAVIADDTAAAPARDVGLGAAGFLVRQRKSLQEPVEGLLAAVERLGVM